MNAHFLTYAGLSHWKYVVNDVFLLAMDTNRTLVEPCVKDGHLFPCMHLMCANMWETAECNLACTRPGIVCCLFFPSLFPLLLFQHVRERPFADQRQGGGLSVCEMLHFLADFVAIHSGVGGGRPYMYLFI